MSEETFQEQQPNHENTNQSSVSVDWNYQKIENSLDKIIEVFWKIAKTETPIIDPISQNELANLEKRIFKLLNYKQQFGNVLSDIFKITKTRVSKQSTTLQFDQFFGYMERLAFYFTLVWEKKEWLSFLECILASITKNSANFKCLRTKRTNSLIVSLFEGKKIYFREIDEKDLVKYLDSNSIELSEEIYSVNEIPNITELTVDEIKLKDLDEIHPILTFTKLMDLNSHFHLAEETKYYVGLKVKKVDKYFEKLLRLNVPESNQVLNIETSPYYDSEEEMIIDVNKRPKSFLIFGDSFSGKGHIGKQLSNHFNSVRLDLEEMAREEFNSKSAIGLNIEKLLKEERSISNSLQIELFGKWISSDYIMDRGYVLEWGTVDSEVRDTILHALHDNPAKYVINLQMSPEETKGRRAELFDRITARLNELELIITQEDNKERHELEEERRKQEMKEEKKRLMQTQKLEMKKKESTEDDNEEEENNEEEEEEVPEEEEDEDEEEDEVKEEKERLKVQEREKQFIERLEYFYLKKKINAEFSDIAPISDTIKIAKGNCKFITVDTSSQSFRDAFLIILQKIGRSTPNIVAINPVVSNTENPEEDPDYEAIISSHLEKGYTWSRWKKYCPVRFRIDRTIVEGSLPALYRGRLYLLSTKEYQKEFINNPRYYLKKFPEKKHRILFVWNGEDGDEIIREVTKFYTSEIVELDQYAKYVSGLPLPPVKEKKLVKKVTISEDTDAEEESPEEEQTEEPENEVIPETSEDIPVSIFVKGSSSLHENSKSLLSILDSHTESPVTSVVIISKEKAEEEEETRLNEEENITDEEPNEEEEATERKDKEHFEKKEPLDLVKVVKEKESEIQSRKIKVIEISFNNLWEGVSTVRKQIDPFYIEATPSSVELPKEDTTPFERDVTVQEEGKIEEQEGDDPGDEELPQKKQIRHRSLGLSGIFCPVTLKNRKLLIKGDSSFCVLYKGKNYIFDNQEAMDEFILKPHIYTSGINNTVPNIWIIGVDQQTNYHSKISEKYDIPIVKFESKFLEEAGSNIEKVINYIRELEKPVEVIKKSKTDEEEEDDDEAAEEEEDEAAKEEKKQRRLCNILKLILKDEKYASGYILTSIPLGDHTEMILNILDELEVFPTLLLNFKVNEEHFVKRNFDTTFFQYKQRLLQKKIGTRKKKEQEKIDIRLKKKKEDDDEEPQEEEEAIKTKEELLEEVQKSYSEALEKTEEIATRYFGKRFVVRDIDTAKPERVVMRQVLEFISLMRDKQQIFDFVTTCDHETATQLVFEGRKKLGFGYFDKLDKLLQTSVFPKMEGNLLTICQNDDPFQYIRPPIPEEIPVATEEQTNTEEKAENEENNEDDEENESEGKSEENDDERDEENEKPIEEEKHPIKTPKPEISFPVVVNNRVFFFKTEQNREIFLKERTKLIEAEIDQKEFRPKILIYGGDPEKREILARRVASKLGCTYVSCLEIVQTFMKYQTFIGTQFRNEENPTPEGDELLSYLKIRLTHFDCVVNGFVIDGIFPTYEDIKAFAKKGDIIDKVFFLDNQDSTTVSNEERQIETLFEMERPFTTVRLGILPDWSLVSSIERAVTNTLHRQYSFFVNSTKNEIPAPLFDVGIDSEFFSEHISRFKTYCPVKFVDEGILYDTITDRTHTNRCFYDGKIYCFCDSTSMQTFVSNYHKYADKNIKFPEELPHEVNDMHLRHVSELQEEEHDDKLANQYDYLGFCPILLSMGMIVWGKSRFSIKYKGKLYRTYSCEGRVKFMQKPWDFVSFKLPTKLPVRQRDWPNLGVVEYLEESVEKLVSSSVLELAKVRPLYRGLTVKESAIKHLAILLKKNNKRLANESK